MGKREEGRKGREGKREGGREGRKKPAIAYLIEAQFGAQKPCSLSPLLLPFPYYLPVLRSMHTNSKTQFENYFLSNSRFRSKLWNTGRE